jgi:hypothetical protein
MNSYVQLTWRNGDTRDLISWNYSWLSITHGTHLRRSYRMYSTSVRYSQ